MASTTIITSNSAEDVISTSPSVTAKVDKVAGKQLSTEDYTNAEKTKLSGVEAGAQVNVVKSVSVSGSGNVVSNATFNNGALTLTKGNISGGPTEASSDDIKAGTDSTKYISAKMNVDSIKTGIIKNAENQSLSDANKKLVQNWLGTNTLIFTFNDAAKTTKTFNFVCNQVISNS